MNRPVAPGRAKALIFDFDGLIDRDRFGRRKFGLLDQFDAICTRDDVSVVKPDPALYLLALKTLGVEADEAIAFEDSPNGIRAAKGAGIFCIFVPNPLTKQLSGEMADRQLNSLEEFSLEHV